jgi:hypothetical protein
VIDGLHTPPKLSLFLLLFSSCPGPRICILHVPFVNMSKAASFSKILQDTISPEQAKWEYSIPDLPASRLTNQTRLIKCVAMISSSQKQEITLRYVLAPSNRVTMGEVLDRFILLSFPDFRLQWPPVATNDASRPATGRENGDWITKMLVSGITINGVSYHFFGHSNSQLKSRSCFMYAASKEEVARKIEAMGDLSKLRSVAKKSKRIGLLFSSAEVSTTLPSERCQDIDDVTSQDYIFTDGCGLMSPQFAKLLAQRRNIVFRDKRYLPSVYQIRYRGYKGVLTLDPTLSGQTQVQFRASMRKFKDSPDYSFAVVDYSKVRNMQYQLDFYLNCALTCDSPMPSAVSMTKSWFCYTRLGSPKRYCWLSKHSISTSSKMSREVIQDLPFSFFPTSIEPSWPKSCSWKARSRCVRRF